MASAGTLTINRDADVFRHVLNFLSNWPLQGAFFPVKISTDELKAIAVEADFFLLPALSWLANAHRINRQCLEPADLLVRQHEDTMRWLFSQQRDDENLRDLHFGLANLYDVCGRTGRVSGRTVELPRMTNPYPLMLEHLSGRGVPSSLLRPSDDFFVKFETHYPGLLSVLHSLPVTENLGWFVAGGSVLRCLMADNRAAAFFDSSDVDIFIFARGEDSAVAATELSRLLFQGVASRSSTVTRTLFTINIQGAYDLQIILRAYHSPAEVLCGFDIDACCMGFGMDRTLWALPRAITALRTSTTILNPLHAWPRQPSYELRLAKYAARGFPVAVPGLLRERGVDGSKKPLDWKVITRSRLIKLRGAARLVHIDMALGLPENCRTYSRSGYGREEATNPYGDGPGFRGARQYPDSWPAAIERTFALNSANIPGPDEDVESVAVPTLPTDYDLVKTIIKDPYGWISNEYNYDVDADRTTDLELKMVQLALEPGGANEDRVVRQAEEAWAAIVDCGTEKLHIPRRMTWSVLPRSREYMNMEIDFTHLWRKYQKPLFDREAALAHVHGPEYGEPHMEQYRRANR